MGYPGLWYTVGCILAMALWGYGGAWYAQRLLAPARESNAICLPHMQALRNGGISAQSAAHHMAQIQARQPAVWASIGRSDQWVTTVYTPVLITLSIPTVVLGAWGALASFQ